MPIEQLRSQLVAVLGFGQEGQATVNYLLKHGIKPVLFDKKPWEEWLPLQQAVLKKLGIEFILGPTYLEELLNFNVAFRSPGIRLDEPGLKAAQSRGLLLTSQTKWFFENSPAPIIGVTGTKGKGTTASLIYEILEHRALLTGNIGLDQPLDFLDELKPADLVIYELSSFQLQDLTASPYIGVVLMVTSEHLDYHPNTASYRQSKQSITAFQKQTDFAIINDDFPASKALGALGQGKKLYFSRQHPVSPGAWVAGGIMKFAGLHQFFPDFPENSKIDLSALHLRGRHNWENVSAAVLAGICAGADVQRLSEPVVAFSGLEHRLELAGKIGGVQYYNDSYSSTPETAIAAIQAFTEPLILIAGGSEKNSDYRELAQVIVAASNLKALVPIGETGPKIAVAVQALNSKLLITQAQNSLASIFSEIQKLAQPGDIVLFSPASASFDMFPNYKERGWQFKQYVKKLANL